MILLLIVVFVAVHMVDIQKGKIFNNEQLRNLFGCSPQGGMRRSIKTNSLILISNHVKTIYEDRWMGELFLYTGMGQKGDQEFISQNKTLAESNENQVDVYLFEVWEVKKYSFTGRVKLAEIPYREIQTDSDGLDRSVLIFPLMLIDGDAPLVSSEQLASLNRKKIKQAEQLSLKELRQRAIRVSPKNSRRILNSTQPVRSPWVTEYAKRWANGVCQLCNNTGPFKLSDGDFYLESHHIHWLSRGGDDSIQNSVALCPNCHTKMHCLDKKKDVSKLVKAVEQHFLTLGDDIENN